MELQLIGLYFGPDQVLPVASILATVAGLILIFWNKIVGLVRRISGFSKRSAAETKIVNPGEKRPPQA